MKLYAKVEERKITAVFGSPQDPDVWGDLEEIDSEDERYVVFVGVHERKEENPLEKIKEFLANNPDVAGLIKA